MPILTRQVTPAEIRAAVRSIELVPRDVLPDGPARARLVELAKAGHRPKVYQSGGHDWCIWSDTLAELRPDREGRVTLAEWREQYAALGDVTATHDSHVGGAA